MDGRSLATVIKVAGVTADTVAPAACSFWKIHDRLKLLPLLFFTFMASQVWADDTSVSLSVDGKPALVLPVPSEAKVVLSNGYVNIRTTNMSLHVWAVPNAKTARAALPRAGELIKSEFINFKTTATTDMVIAGAPALHVVGAGNEADDSDPGHAEVVLFVVGGQVFAGCVHGEFDDASRARAPMMALLQNAHASP
jgi:hypothetical protein